MLFLESFGVDLLVIPGWLYQHHSADYILSVLQVQLASALLARRTVTCDTSKRVTQLDAKDIPSLRKLSYLRSDQGLPRCALVVRAIVTFLAQFVAGTGRMEREEEQNQTRHPKRF